MRIYGMKGVTDIVNLTPHEVTIAMWEDNPLVLPSEGVARVEELGSQLHFLPGGLEIKRLVYGRIVDLPPPAGPGVLYLVSRILLQAAEKDPSHALRRDLVAPGDLLRGPGGKITGCSNLIANGPLDLIEGHLQANVVVDSSTGHTAPNGPEDGDYFRGVVKYFARRLEVAPEEAERRILRLVEENKQKRLQAESSAP